MEHSLEEAAAVLHDSLDTACAQKRLRLAKEVWAGTAKVRQMQESAAATGRPLRALEVALAEAHRLAAVRSRNGTNRRTLAEMHDSFHCEHGYRMMANDFDLGPAFRDPLTDTMKYGIDWLQQIAGRAAELAAAEEQLDREVDAWIEGVGPKPMEVVDLTSSQGDGGDALRDVAVGVTGGGGGGGDCGGGGAAAFSGGAGGGGGGSSDDVAGSCGGGSVGGSDRGAGRGDPGCEHCGGGATSPHEGVVAAAAAQHHGASFQQAGLPPELVQRFAGHRTDLAVAPVAAAATAGGGVGGVGGGSGGGSGAGGDAQLPAMPA
ncbi:unnamed protein product [Phaeothamnion confervicola]